MGASHCSSFVVSAGRVYISRTLRSQSLVGVPVRFVVGRSPSCQDHSLVWVVRSEHLLISSAGRVYILPQAPHPICSWCTTTSRRYPQSYRVKSIVWCELHGPIAPSGADFHSGTVPIVPVSCSRHRVVVPRKCATNPLGLFSRCCPGISGLAWWSSRTSC